MRIVIMGAGAIGSLYGGLLALRYPGSVTLVGRSPLVEQVRTHGLHIEGVMGSHIVSVDATDNASSIKSADIVLVTTKTYDTVAAAKAVKHLVDNGSYLVLVQNGLGTEVAVSEALNSTRVIRATTCMGALMTTPGNLHVTGRGLTEIGSRYPENIGMIRNIADLFQSAGLDVKISDNIEGVVWTKTIVNCGINPIGALTGMTNGEIHRNPALRELVIRLVEETAAVAKALGVELTTDNPVRYTLGTAKATAENINSMLRDIQLRKRTEIDSITGAVIWMGKELGIATPVSETVYALIKAIESKYLAGTELSNDVAVMAIDELLGTIYQH